MSSARAKRFGALRLRRARTSAHRLASRAVLAAYVAAIALAGTHGVPALLATLGCAAGGLAVARLAIRRAAWARISRLVLSFDLLAATFAIELLAQGRDDLSLAPMLVLPTVAVYRDGPLVRVTTIGAMAIALVAPGATPLETGLRIVTLAVEGFLCDRVASRSAARIERAAASAARERKGLLDALDLAREELAASERASAERDAAQASAREAVAARAVFLNHLSHELRTPLNAVVGYLDLLGTTFLDPEQEAHVAGARTSAHHVLALVHDVLDHAKIEGGKLELARKPFELADVVRSAVRLVETSAHAKRLSLQLDLADELPDWLEGDPLRVRQVLLNLLTNAIKFTPSGSVRLTVRRLAPGPGVRFDVSDDGVGIPESARSRIFDPYRQASALVAQEHGGTGLGLSISRRLAHAMGGDLTFDSQPGVGTTFHFDAPLPTAENPAAVDTARIEPAGPTRPLRVLLAEDNATNRFVTTRLLQALGHDVVTVENGLQAVARCLAGSFDLVIMDVEMPELDGLGATCWLRDAGMTLPILAFTAHESAERDAACRAAGMDGVLHKPLELAELRRAVVRYARASASDDGQVAPEAMPPRDRPISGWVDRAAIRAKLQGNQKLEGQLMQTVAHETTALAEQLRIVMDRRDALGIRRAARALAVCIANVGKREVVASLERVEEAASAGDADLAAKLGGPVLAAIAALKRDPDPGSDPSRHAA
ncbi:MAG: ATP-binding protein [Sandaracinus sp.]